MESRSQLRSWDDFAENRSGPASANFTGSIRAFRAFRSLAPRLGGLEAIQVDDLSLMVRLARYGFEDLNSQPRRSATALPRSRLNRLISAHFQAAVRRVRSRPRKTILHNDDADSKSFLCQLTDNLRGSGQTRLRGRSLVGKLERKKEMKAYRPGAERSV
jgi:hypothetical protein